VSHESPQKAHHVPSPRRRMLYSATEVAKVIV
jgi:hypothetical protein